MSIIKIIFGGIILLEIYVFSAVGEPTPQILWLKNGMFLVDEQSTNGHSTLHVHVRDHQDTGNYMCLAKNIAGAARASASIELVGRVPNKAPPIAKVC